METQEEKAKIKAKVLKAMEAIRQRLLLRQPFIGSIMMQQELVPVFDSRVPTACTDGTHVFFSCRFFAQLTMPERSFVLAHEVWHTVLMHAQRQQHRDKNLFNVAADLEIHFILQEENFHEPFILPHDPRWRGLSAEEIYERLRKLAEDSQPLEGGKQSKNIKAIRPDGGMDTHLTDQDASPANTGEEDGGNTTGDDSGDFDGTARANGGKTETTSEADRKNAGNDTRDGEHGDSQTGGAQAKETHEDRDGAPELEVDPDFRPVPPSSSTETVRRQLIQAAQRAERQAGTIPGCMQNLLKQIRQPQIRWQELLKQYVTSLYGGQRHWLPPARRYIGSGLYLPSRRDMRIKAVVAIDTSGSTEDYISQFFGELNGILKSFGNYDLTVIQCDCEIQKVDHYDESTPMRDNKSFALMGGGGTNFLPVFQYISEHIIEPNVLLFLTDGYGKAPLKPPHYPVMWILTPEGQTPVNWGQKLWLHN